MKPERRNPIEKSPNKKWQALFLALNLGPQIAQASPEAIETCKARPVIQPEVVFQVTPRSEQDCQAAISEICKAIESKNSGEVAMPEYIVEIVGTPHKGWEGFSYKWPEEIINNEQVGFSCNVSSDADHFIKLSRVSPEQINQAQEIIGELYLPEVVELDPAILEQANKDHLFNLGFTLETNHFTWISRLSAIMTDLASRPEEIRQQLIDAGEDPDKLLEELGSDDTSLLKKYSIMKKIASYSEVDLTQTYCTASMPIIFERDGNYFTINLVVSIDSELEDFRASLGTSVVKGIGPKRRFQLGMSGQFDVLTGLSTPAQDFSLTTGWSFNIGNTNLDLQYGAGIRSQGEDFAIGSGLTINIKADKRD